MSRMRVILHGKAAGNQAVRAAIGTLRREGHEIGVRVTWEAGDASCFARQAVEDARAGQIDCIVAGGGDGTLNEVIGAAWQASPPEQCSFGILPLGTANDFAHSTGIPVTDPEAALRLVAETPARAIDLGLFDTEPFVNLVSGGFGSQVTAETDPDLKRHLGGLAYILSGLVRLGDMEPCRGRFRAEGFEWEGEFLAFALGNGRQAGGGITLCPEARLDDGKIDLMILPALLENAGTEAIRTLIHEGAASLERFAIRTRSDSIQFESDKEIFVNLDGESRRIRSARITCCPRALRVHLGQTPLL